MLGPSQPLECERVCRAHRKRWLDWRLESGRLAGRPLCQTPPLDYFNGGAGRDHLRRPLGLLVRLDDVGDRHSSLDELRALQWFRHPW